MGVVWIEPDAPGMPLRLRLLEATQTPLAQVERALDNCGLRDPDATGGSLVLDVGEHLIGASGLAAMRERLLASGFNPVGLVSSNPHSCVAAAALGMAWDAPASGARSDAASSPGQPPSGRDHLTVHRGMVRSGEELDAPGSLLVLGDVNPGARVQAGGHVLVWGRLRGLAHAGCRGDSRARIVALQLQPLQLRIAQVVARGPEEAPPAGLAEEARLEGGVIRIDAASPIWPLSG